MQDKTEKIPDFSEMSEQHRQGLYLYFMNRLRNTALAEDLTQDSMVKAWRYYPPKNQDSIRAWFYTIAKNVLRDHFRHKQVVDKHQDFLKDGLRGKDAGIDEKVLQVQECMNCLDPESREILTLREMEGFKVEEIMQHLDLSRDRVRYRLKKAREKFAQLYNRSGL
jgi:RNA polymerase sigma-70 factor (ECF subfamily)